MFHDASTHRLFAGYGDAFRPRRRSTAATTADPVCPSRPGRRPTPTSAPTRSARSPSIRPPRAAGIGSTRLYATGRSGQYPGCGCAMAASTAAWTAATPLTTIDSGLPTVGNPRRPTSAPVRSLCSIRAPAPCRRRPVPCTSGSAADRLTRPPTAQYRGVPTGSASLKSSNGGDSWVSSDTGIPADLPRHAHPVCGLSPFWSCPSSSTEQSAGTLRRNHAHLQFPPRVPVPTVPAGVFRSTDGGATWTQRSNGLPRHAGSTDTAFDVLSLAMNPANPLELWCSVVDLSGSTAASGGIYHTLDGGANWSNSSSGLTSVDIRAIYVDPANPSVIYAVRRRYRGQSRRRLPQQQQRRFLSSISVGCWPMPRSPCRSIRWTPACCTPAPTAAWEPHAAPDADADGVPDVVKTPPQRRRRQQRRHTRCAGAQGRFAAERRDPRRRRVAERRTRCRSISRSPSRPQWRLRPGRDVQSVYAAYHGNDVSSYGDDYAPRASWRASRSQLPEGR